MKVRLTIAVLVVATVGGLIFLLARPKSNSQEHSSMNTGGTTKVETPAAENSVSIQNYKFNPSPIRVKKGATVTWTNQDVARHSVVVDEGQPSGGPSGSLFGKGETYQFTFSAVGTYKYHCEPHPYMHGVVEVTE